ncbi:APC family permease [Nocardioides fonticola]|uniref:APC family permease n=1 Tax=Nocardioides fonticola TaxID=450363 RepID=A0ABP7X9Z3_9ACTN
MTTAETNPAPTTAADAAAPAHEFHRLRPGSIGLVAVLFMAVANAAPITAMTGNVPIAVGYGNGIGAPAGFLVATVILTIFSIGYVAMAKHITATGAFYGFISHGLGRTTGFASGVVATLAYVVFEASLVGIFASFAKTLLPDFFISEFGWALICVAVVAVLGYFEISISGIVLGVFLVGEIIMLGALALSVVIKGGGPDGFVFSALNPLNAFDAAPSTVAGGGAAVTATAAVGLFFAFWSWVGFETTAVYGEESKDPKTIVPRATLMAVIGLGVFYVLVSWLVIAGNGTDQAIAVSRGSTGNSFDVFLDLTRANLGGPTEKIYEILACTGSFACAMAFHNAASRYLYAFGREGIISPLGRTHGVHKSPHVASITQSVITLAITLGFFFLQDPTESAPDVFYFYQYGLLAIMGTMALLIVQTICSVAVVCYFHVGKHHPESAHWFTTLTAPILGAIGMAYVVYLLFDNLTFAAGAASGSPVFTATPYLVIGTFVAGVLGALALRQWAPAIYERTGRVVMDDSHER